jgi:hypothetical protein
MTSNQSVLARAHVLPVLIDGPITPTKIVIGPVAILADGSIERTDAFTTNDAAAIEFWKAVQDLVGRVRQARFQIEEAFASS